MVRRQSIGLVAIALAIGATGAFAQTQVKIEPPGCPQWRGEIVVLREINDEGDFVLADGRHVRLSGLDLGRGALSEASWAAHRARLNAELAEKRFRLEPTMAVSDRWGRLPALLGLISDKPGENSVEPLADRLTGLGLARFASGEGLLHCLRNARQAEIAARKNGLGLWKDPRTKLFPSDNPAEIKALSGHFVVVEGTITRVTNRRTRIYLNFGRRINRDFYALVPGRFLNRLSSAGITPSLLSQKRVRIRGIVGGLRAPRIVVVTAEQIEVLDEARP